MAVSRPKSNSRGDCASLLLDSNRQEGMFNEVGVYSCDKAHEISGYIFGHAGCVVPCCGYILCSFDGFAPPQAPASTRLRSVGKRIDILVL